MKEIAIDELKTIQLDILSAVSDFCRSNNIRYSLACGTMLGCIRHKGYIPWDDDVDIYLLREDYDKMVRVFPQILNGKYAFATYERNKAYTKTFGKVYDVRTRLEESHGDTTFMGVNIDVFPIDRVPETEENWRDYDNIRRKLIEYHFIKSYGFKILKYHREYSFSKNVVNVIGKAFLRCIPLRCLTKLVDRYCRKYNNTSSPYCFECVQGILQKRPFPISVFESIVEKPFENRSFMAFNDYDSYLTNAYGNWQQLPPVEKQVSHHSFNAWWL